MYGLIKRAHTSSFFLVAYVGSEYDLSRSQDKDADGPIGVPTLPMQKKSGLTTSSSSREQSDDEEVEGETEITENMDPADAKRVRR